VGGVQGGGKVMGTERVSSLGLPCSITATAQLEVP
jgi:hypothetical protein